MNLGEIEWDDTDWIALALEGSYEHGNEFHEMLGSS
jgi:hypothetical protein